MNRAEAQNSTSFASQDGSVDEFSKEFFPDFGATRSALEGARIGVWCWDIATDKVIWSSNLEAIHRLPPGGFDGTLAGFLRTVHRDDRGNIEAALREALRSHDPYRVRYRLREQIDDEDCWLEAVG